MNFKSFTKKLVESYTDLYDLAIEASMKARTFYDEQISFVELARKKKIARIDIVDFMKRHYRLSMEDINRYIGEYDK